MWARSKQGMVVLGKEVTLNPCTSSRTSKGRKETNSRQLQTEHSTRNNFRQAQHGIAQLQCALGPSALEQAGRLGAAQKGPRACVCTHLMSTVMSCEFLAGSRPAGVSARNMVARALCTDH
jgi:hypothetical protein